jgi:tRNA(adenine34) deaminase
MNREFLDLAFELANKAFTLDEVPIGAIIVKDNRIIGCGYNQKESNNSVLKHAELIAIEEASKNLNNWRLDDCDIYITLDPCPMCASAIKQARIKNVYSALNNTDEKYLEIIEKVFIGDKTNPSVNFVSNLAVNKSKNLLNSFFKKQRNN